jgi:hypothetical protein
MREKFTVIVGALLMLLVWASAASASPFHHHEKKSSALKNHEIQHACPLDHNQKGIPCPHSLSKKDPNGYQIAPDCGGSPLASVPSSASFSKNLFFVSNSCLIKADHQVGGLTLISPRHKFTLSFQLDHPPKSL